jgi:RNA polymerase sigma factor (sigma-70 family)
MDAMDTSIDQPAHARLDAEASQSSTKTLLDRGRGGDRAALDRLFTRVLRRIRRWAHGRLSKGARTAADTADVVQDATLGVWRRIDTIELNRPGDLEAYIRESVQNRIRDQARRLARTPERGELHSDIPLKAPSPLEEAVNREFFTRYATAIAKLSQEERELIVARFELGYSYRQIAALLKKPSPAAARMMVNRIIARLQAGLD